jgi:ABC-type uncharacterized transport system permease subunit
MNDKDFKKIFTDYKTDVPDNGFSKRVVRQLPERKNVLPQIIMLLFIVIGLALVFVLQGFTPILEQINDLIFSISHQKVPSLASIAAYFCVLTLLSFIGYSVVQVGD